MSRVLTQELSFNRFLMIHTIKPLGDRIVVSPLGEEDRFGKTKSGIVIPDTAQKERPEQGRVVAVGEGRVTDGGKVITPRVKKGQIVLFAQFTPTEIKVDGIEYLILRESDVLAIME